MQGAAVSTSNNHLEGSPVFPGFWHDPNITYIGGLFAVTFSWGHFLQGVVSTVAACGVLIGGSAQLLRELRERRERREASTPRKAGT
jgi:hypothetical protein